MDNKWIVETNRVCKVLDETEIIKSCSIHVKQGSIYGFLGMNGAGKTTIFKLLIGLLTPTSGNVKIMGNDNSRSHKESLKSIGSIIEVPAFYDHLSASENLRIHLKYMGKEDGDIARTLDMVGLDNKSIKPVSAFSLGMKQRLGIARAIVHKPKVLILDEPLNGLDPMGIREMRELFLKLKSEGVTIIISSHILTDIEHIADSIGIIADGKIIEEVSMAKIKEDSSIENLEDYFFQKVRRNKKYA